jgi:hypothetical protein
MKRQLVLEYNCRVGAAVMVRTRDVKLKGELSLIVEKQLRKGLARAKSFKSGKKLIAQT